MVGVFSSGCVRITGSLRLVSIFICDRGLSPSREFGAMVYVTSLNRRLRRHHLRSFKLSGPISI